LFFKRKGKAMKSRLGVIIFAVLFVAAIVLLLVDNASL